MFGTHTKLMMSNGFERLQKTPPPDVCSGMCFVWVEPVGRANANKHSETVTLWDIKDRRDFIVCAWICENRPATCLMRWTTSSSVGVVTGLRLSSRWAVRRCVRGLFLLLRVFFNALALGDGLWDSIWASSIFANSSSEKFWSLGMLWAELRNVVGVAQHHVLPRLLKFSSSPLQKFFSMKLFTRPQGCFLYLSSVETLKQITVH